TTAGEGMAEESVVAATIAHTPMTPAIPARGGASSLASHLARATRVDLPHQQLVDLRDDARDEDVVEVARARGVDPELLQEPSRRGRHDEHAVGQQGRLPDVVGHEQERLRAARV